MSLCWCSLTEIITKNRFVNLNSEYTFTTWGSTLSMYLLNGSKLCVTIIKNSKYLSHNLWKYQTILSICLSYHFTELLIKYIKSNNLLDKFYLHSCQMCLSQLSSWLRKMAGNVSCWHCLIVTYFMFFIWNSSSTHKLFKGKAVKSSWIYTFNIDQRCQFVFSLLTGCVDATCVYPKNWFEMKCIFVEPRFRKRYPKKNITLKHGARTSESKARLIK